MHELVARSVAVLKTMVANPLTFTWVSTIMLPGGVLVNKPLGRLRGEA
jgi:hypothetical protein